MSNLLKILFVLYIIDISIHLYCCYNEIINITPSCPQASNIIMDEENRQYIFEFINTKYKQIC